MISFLSFCAGVENEGSNLRYSGPFSWWQDMLHRQPPLTPDRGKALARELPAQFDFKGEKLMLDKPRDRAEILEMLGKPSEFPWDWEIFSADFIRQIPELEEVGDAKP